MTLDDLGIARGTDKSSKHHDYCKIYQQYFEPLKNAPIVLIEAGYGGYDYPDRGGQSAIMWLDYFTQASIIVTDLHPKNCVSAGRFHFYQGGQDDQQLFEKIAGKHGRPDIFIDDASHVTDLSLKTFEIVFPLLNSGGWYVIEDTEGCFGNGWSKGTLNYNDFNFPHPLNLGRQLINDINSQYIPRYEERHPVESIHFHKNIIFIKKK